MLRTKEFQYMKVENKHGKYLGFVKDIAINYNSKNVIGFKISTFSLFSKDTYVLKEDIVCMNEKLIVEKTIKEDLLCFNDIKFLDVITCKGCMLGVLEDLIIDIKTFTIKAIIVGTGIINKMVNGKEVLLINNTILGEFNVLYYPNSNIRCFSLPHKLIGVEEYEEDCY